MSQRQAVTKTKARAYARAGRAGKGRILDELVELTGWHRDHARAALREALKPRVVRPRPRRAPTYGPRIIGALVRCWAVLRAPGGKRLAPMLPVRTFEWPGNTLARDLAPGGRVRPGHDERMQIRLIR